MKSSVNCVKGGRHHKELACVACLNDECDRRIAVYLLMEKLEKFERRRPVNGRWMMNQIEAEIAGLAPKQFDYDKLFGTYNGKVKA